MSNFIITYRGFEIKRQPPYISIYDNKGNYVRRIFGHSITSAKSEVDKILKQRQN